MDPTEPIRQLHEQGTVIRSAPYPFALVAVAIAVGTYGAMELIYRRRIENYKETIEHLKTKLELGPDGGTEPADTADGSKEKLSIPRVGFGWLGFDYMRHIWFTAEQPQGHFGLMAIVENSLAAPGETTAKASNLAASLEFFDSGGRSTVRSARTYWLKHSENEVAIAAGEERTVLVGVYRGEYVEIYTSLSAH